MKKLLRNTFLLLALIVFMVPRSHAGGESGHKITLKIQGLKDTTVLLAYYFGAKQYIKDTADIDSKGVAVFQGSEPLPAGIYMAVLPDKSYFEFLVNNQQEFTLETKYPNPVPNMKVKGSKENDEFYEYLQSLSGKQEVILDLRKKVEELKDVSEKADEYEKAREDLQKREEEMNQYKLDFMENFPDNFASKVFRTAKDPEIPEAPTLPDGSKDSTFAFRYFKSHFFDNVDFDDERLLYTPIFHQKIDTYLQRLTVQDPDSIVESVKTIMGKADKNDEIYKYCTIFITNKYAKDKRMCFDKVYVYMGETVYLKGRAFWVDSTQLAKITDRVMKMKYNQCGNWAVNLDLEGEDDSKVSLKDIKAKFTIIYFWDYDCGHCKKVTPVMLKFYHEYKEHGVKVLGVCTRDDIEKWEKYIKDNELDWINGIDPEHKSYFRVYYDIYSTPVIYLLDENKKIVAKRLDIYGLEQFIRHELGLPQKENSEYKPDKEMREH